MLSGTAAPIDPRITEAEAQRKNTNGYRAMWSAKGEAAVRTVVATARLTAGASSFDTVLSTIRA